MLTTLGLRYWGSCSRIWGRGGSFMIVKNQKRVTSLQCIIVRLPWSLLKSLWPQEVVIIIAWKMGAWVLKKSSHVALFWWEACALEEWKPPLTRTLALVLYCILKEKMPFLILVKVSWLWATVLAKLPKHATQKLPLKFCLCPSCHYRSWYKALLLGAPEDACFHTRLVSHLFAFLQKHPQCPSSQCIRSCLHTHTHTHTHTCTKRSGFQLFHINLTRDHLNTLYFFLSLSK